MQESPDPCQEHDMMMLPGKGADGLPLPVLQTHLTHLPLKSPAAGRLLFLLFGTCSNFQTGTPNHSKVAWNAHLDFGIGIGDD